MDKPFKGQIYSWKRRYYEDGFSVVGLPHGHPDFVGWIWTSLVIDMWEIPRHRGDERRFEIETLNSRYELVGEELNAEIPCPANNYLKHGLTPPQRQTRT